MHDWLLSCAEELNLCPQALCIFGIDRDDGSGVLLKVIPGVICMTY